METIWRDCCRRNVAVLFIRVSVRVPVVLHWFLIKVVIASSLLAIRILTILSHRKWYATLYIFDGWSWKLFLFQIWKNEKLIQNAPVVVFDANLSIDCIGTILELCGKFNVPGNFYLSFKYASPISCGLSHAIRLLYH